MSTYIAPKKKYDGKSDLIYDNIIPLYFAALQNQIKESTIYEKQKLFALIITPYFENKKITDITKADLYLWQDELWAKKKKDGSFYSYKYLSKIRAYFSDFLRWCADRYGTVNYLYEVKKPKRRTPPHEMQFWERYEFDAFIAVVDNPLWHTFFSVLFFTGCRKGEALALTQDDVRADEICFSKSVTRKTLDDSTYKVTSTKTDKIRHVPLAPMLQEELLAYKGGEPFYFGGQKPLSDNSMRRAFNLYAEKANVKIIRIHDLRHSFVSMLIHKGANFALIAELIGDTITQVSITYAHFYKEDKRKIMDNL